MALTPSTMLPLGTQAPDFSLPDTEGTVVRLDNFSGKKGLAILFICNHCPYVKHIREGLAKFGADYQGKIGIVAISSNDPKGYPDDSPEKMVIEKKSAGYTFPYLFDGDQSVAKAYRAACTPDLYLFDAALKLVYRGQFDESRPGNGLPVTGKDLRTAVDAVLSGRLVEGKQTPSIGCNIKWTPGNEPDYFG